MIRKRISLFCIGLAMTFCVKGQELSLYSGLSQASMAELKGAREYVILNAGVNVKVTSDFPVYWRYGGMLTFRIRDNMRLGFQASTTSTGSRATYEDYSGYVRFDQVLTNFAIGPHFQSRVKHHGPWEIWFYGEEGVIFTRYKADYVYKAPDDFRRMNTGLNSINLFSELGIMGQYRLTRMIKIFASMGIQINSGGEMDYHSDDGFLYGYNDALSTDWTGMKMNVGVTLGRFQ